MKEKTKYWVFYHLTINLTGFKTIYQLVHFVRQDQNQTVEVT